MARNYVYEVYVHGEDKDPPKVSEERIKKIIKDLAPLLHNDGTDRLAQISQATCESCATTCQMIGLDMPACYWYKPFIKE